MFFVDITGSMRNRRGNFLRIHIEYAAFFTFLSQQAFAFLPDCGGVFRSGSQKICCAFIRRIVLLNKVTHIQFHLPLTGTEALPHFFHNVNPPYIIFNYL